MRLEYKGDILTVRAVEDSIRATNKYTKGLSRLWRPVKHPIQGEIAPSKLLIEYYEVYPDTDLEEKLPLIEAWQKFWAWTWGDVSHIDVKFVYDYRKNEASIAIAGGQKSVKKLSRGIPNFSETLSVLQNYVRTNGKTILAKAAHN